MTKLIEMRSLLPPGDILWSYAFIHTAKGECRLVAFLLECPVFEAFEQNDKISVGMCRTGYINHWGGSDFWAAERLHDLDTDEAAALFVKLMDMSR